MKKFHYLTLATALSLLLCSCSKSEPIGTSNSLPASTESSDISSSTNENYESNTDADAQTYEKLYEELYNRIYFELYNELYTEIYFKNYTPPQNCGKIDRSLDCGQIVLDRADALKKMMRNYYYGDQTELTYKKGDEELINKLNCSGYKVVSDEFKTYSEFKGLFNNSIYDKYIDMINYSWGFINYGFREIDGELYICYLGGGGPRGTAETWYLGYDVEDDRIIGHFAELLADVGSNEPLTAEFLNDESNYNFYEIIIQNVDGNYVITNCVGSDNQHYYLEHGLCYNSGFADRSLITNPKVMPKK